MISKLSALASSDPDKFKTLTAQIASQLTTAANNASGPEADFLKQLAQKFTDASQTGDASKLQPSGHHHRHHHHASAAYASQSSTADSTSTASSGSQQSTGTGPSADVKALFDQIEQEVAQA